MSKKEVALLGRLLLPIELFKKLSYNSTVIEWKKAGPKSHFLEHVILVIISLMLNTHQESREYQFLSLLV